MSKPEFLNRLRVPKHRVADAAPIALVVFVVSMWPGLLGIAAVAMLQAWLWLRHPRTASRYLIAVVVLGLFVCTAGMHRSQFYSFRQIGNLGDVVTLVGCTGILPIGYRLVSRYSLWFQKDDAEGVTSKSHGSIFDILMLSAFCAVLFVQFQNVGANRWYLTDLANLVSVCFAISFGAVIAMRLLAKPRGVVAFLTCFVVALAVLVFHASANAIAFVLTSDSSGEITWERVGDSLVVSLTNSMLLCVFAVVNRWCGVTLAPTGIPPALQSSETEPGWYQNLALGFARWSARAFVAMLLSIIFFGPGAARRSELSAGWPANFLHAMGDARNGDALSRFEVLYFSGGWLFVDVVFWIALCFVVMTPKSIMALSPRRVMSARIVALIGFIGLVFYTCWILPNRYDAKAVRFAAKSRAEPFYGSLTEAVGAAAVDSMGLEIDRTRAYDVWFSDLDAEDTKDALSLNQLRSITLLRCDVTQAAMREIHGSRFVKKLAFIDCKIEGSIEPLIKSLPRLKQLDPPHEQPLTQVCQELGVKPWLTRIQLALDEKTRVPHLSKAVTKLTLVVPNGVSRTIDLDNIPFVKALVVRNTVGHVPAGTVKVQIKNATKLVDLQLDNCQRIDLSIDQAPRLVSISDTLSAFENRERNNLTENDCLARLSGLELKGVPNLSELRADIAECDSIKIHDEGLRLESCVISSVSAGHVADDHRLDAAKLSSLAIGLGRLHPRRVTLLGMEVDQSVVGSLFDAETECIAMLRCNVAGDAFATYPKEASLDTFDALDYSPSDQQFSRLTDSAKNIDSIRIDASRLTELPERFLPTGFVVLLNANGLRLSAEQVYRADSYVTCSESQLRGDVDLKDTIRFIGEQSVLDDDWIDDGQYLGPHKYWLQANTANDDVLAGLQSKLSKGRMRDMWSIRLMSPTADLNKLANFNWLKTVELMLYDAKVTDVTLKSWQVPDLDVLAICRLDVSADLINQMFAKGPNLSKIAFVKTDLQTPLPEFKPDELRSRFLLFGGREISASDIKSILQGRPASVEFSNCELSPAAIERVWHRKYKYTPVISGIDWSEVNR